MTSPRKSSLLDRATAAIARQRSKAPVPSPSGDPDPEHRFRKLKKQIKQTEKEKAAAVGKAEEAQRRLDKSQASLKQLRKEKARLESEMRALSRRLPAGDDLRSTAGFQPIAQPSAPYVLGRRGRMKVLFVNSMGGSMGRLSKALMLHENIEADCYVAAYPPAKHMTNGHETNINGIYSHQDWREFLQYAVRHYDIVQSTTLPLQAGVARCYDWLTDTLGRRHIWRATGFVHHFLHREDILPLAEYQRDLGRSDRAPSPDRFQVRSLAIDPNWIYTDPNVVFYSSPEKGAYLNGSDTHWLPSMRDPEVFHPDPESRRNYGDQGSIYVYVPYHHRAMFKGLSHAIDAVRQVQERFPQVILVTAANASEVFPDLKPFEALGPDGESPTHAYPMQSYNMPEIYKRVDIVIDQLLFGSYGNTGIEAMFTGKPVIGQKRYQELADAPVVDAEVDTLADRLAELVESPDRRQELGQAGLDFAMRTHAPAAIANIAAETYRRVLDES